MSLIVCAKTGEGIVLGADNLISIYGSIGNKTGILNTYEHSKKIVQLKGLPVGVAFWGMGHISKRTIRSYILEFDKYLFTKYLKDKNSTKYKTEEIALELSKFINRYYEKEFIGSKQPVLGLLVTGFTPEEFFGEVFACIYPDKRKPIQLRAKEDFGMNWFGVTDAINRFYKGFDPKVIDILMKDFDFDAKKVKKLKSILAENVEYKVIFDSMPIQEAIDLTYELIELTITRNRFTIGAPTVGGNIDIAVITPEDKFFWVNQEEWNVSER